MFLLTVDVNYRILTIFICYLSLFLFFSNFLSLLFLINNLVAFGLYVDSFFNEVVHVFYVTLYSYLLITNSSNFTTNVELLLFFLAAFFVIHRTIEHCYLLFFNFTFSLFLCFLFFRRYFDILSLFNFYLCTSFINFLAISILCVNHTTCSITILSISSLLLIRVCAIIIQFIYVLTLCFCSVKCFVNF